MLLTLARLMLWPFHYKTEARYWIKVFALYAMAEAFVQLLFYFLFNTFGTDGGSNLEYHLIMWFFHCLLIWPVWWVAWSVRNQKVILQVVVNIAFFFAYGYFWFGPVQELIAVLYNNLLDITQPGNNVQVPTIDSSKHYSILNYQILKHAFRLSWFYLANYFYNYKREEQKRIELAVFNKELQLKLLKWHLNPSFYFKTIKQLQQSAATQPSNATEPILQLAKVMEYVIYEAREPLIEMKKEIQFLNNYIQLINQHPENKVQIELEYESGYEKLKIAPLLLAELVDDMVLNGQGSVNTTCRIRMKFIQTKLYFSANGSNVKPAASALLNELYPKKFFAEYSTEKGFNLRLELDET